MDLMFEILPVDRGVVLLIDRATGALATHLVKFRQGSSMEGKTITLSSTILKKTYESRRCIVTVDTSQENDLKNLDSINEGGIRSIVCIPLISHNKVNKLFTISL